MVLIDFPVSLSLSLYLHTSPSKRPCYISVPCPIRSHPPPPSPNASVYLQIVVDNVAGRAHQVDGVGAHQLPRCLALERRLRIVEAGVERIARRTVRRRRPNDHLRSAQRSAGAKRLLLLLRVAAVVANAGADARRPERRLIAGVAGGAGGEGGGRRGRLRRGVPQQMLTRG